MFRRKRAKEEAPQQVDSAPSQPVTRANGYVVTELPTYHGLKRKVVVYTSDPSGRIIKTFKR